MKTPETRAWVEHIMGMPISLHVRGEDTLSPEVERQAGAVFAELRHVDRIFSPYKVDSDLRRWWNDGIPLEQADPVLREMLRLCEQARSRTDGHFDARNLPDPIGSGAMLDPSGAVKGWAVDRAARHLRVLTRHGWCLNAGGDVLVHAPDDQPLWRVGIEDPGNLKRVARVLTLRSGAVATSGTARRGTHIRGSKKLVAATVTGPTLTWADILATAVVACGAGAPPWLESFEGYEAVHIVQGT